MALENEILKAYLKTNHEVSRQFRGHYGKLNLTFPQALVLSILEGQGRQPISSLAETTGSANSTISGVVDRLERMGLVRRVRSESDRRVIYVETTEQYRDIREKTVTSVNNYFAQLLEDVSPEDQETIYRGLCLLGDVLKKEL